MVHVRSRYCEVIQPADTFSNVPDCFESGSPEDTTGLNESEVLDSAIGKVCASPALPWYYLLLTRAF